MLNHLFAIAVLYLVFKLGMEYGVDKHYRTLRKKQKAEQAKLPRARRV